MTLRAMRRIQQNAARSRGRERKSRRA
jgi:hypothetical protein